MDVDINKVKNVERIRISEFKGIEPIEIDRLSNIAPLAAHIKEVNHIDPISVDALHVSEIKNIDPIRVERFNITDLPAVNVLLRQLPALDMNVRQLPAVSVGTHQTFSLPSTYTVRASFMGIEFLRVHVDGHTGMLPGERYRREQARTENQSFPVPATAGNPAIPSSCREESARACVPAAPPGRPALRPGCQAPSGATRPPGVPGRAPGPGLAPNPVARRGSFHVGPPAMSFHFSEERRPGAGPMAGTGPWPPAGMGGPSSSVRSGG